MEQVSLRDYCDEARSLIESGEFDGAIRITRHILRHYPRHVESYRLLGQALLEAGNYQEAAKQFRRVLSADPENVTSRIGLSRIHEITGEVGKAIWQMRRAFDLSPDDPGLRQQLRRLINTRQGDRAERLEITRAALGRIYARGGLHAKAVQEFKAVLAQEPDRVDVQVALAEVLWQAGRHLEAIEVCHHTLEKHPHTLKANLVIGAMGLDSRQPDEAESHLSLAQALDPENTVAQSFFGEGSPLVPLTIKVERLGEVEIEDARPKPPPTLPDGGVPPSRELEPAMGWMSELHEEETTPMSDEERPDEEYQFPDWLQGVGDDLLEDEGPQAPVSAPTGSSTEDETPGWLRDLVARTEEPRQSPHGGEGEPPGTPDEPSPAEPGDVPDWLQELRPESPQETPTDSGAPDWLAAIAAGHPPDETQPEAAPSTVAPPSTPTTSDADQLDWLSELQEPEATSEAEQPPLSPETGGEEVEVPPVSVEETEPSVLEPISGVVEESEVPDWLREIAAGEPVTPEAAEPTAEAAPALPEAPLSRDEAGLPDWLQDLEGPAAEEAEPEAQPELPEAVGEPVAGADEGRALWEQILAEEGIDLASAEEVRPPEAEGMTAEEWLRSTADLAAEQPATTPPEPEAEPLPAEAPEAPTVPMAEAEVDEAPLSRDEAGLPDWLRDFEEPAGEEEAIELATTETEPAAGVEVVEEELPDWLREIEEPAVAEAEPSEPGLPDWLRQVSAGEPVPTEEGEPVAPTPEAAVPDRLAEVQESPELALPTAEVAEHPPSEVEAEAAELPDWSREPTVEPAAEFPAGEAGPTAEVPEWLKALESEEMPLAEPTFDEPIELETGEMPEWLGEVMTEEPPLTEEWGEPEATEAQEVEAPDWLGEFREEEKEITPEPTAEGMEPEAPAEIVLEGEKAPSELPDWLRRLREGVLEEAPPTPAEYPPGEVEFAPAEAPVEAVEYPPSLPEEKGEALPAEAIAEPEIIQPEAGGPEWLGELVRDEESLAELEAIEEEVTIPEAAAPTPVEYIEIEKAEAPPVAPPEAVAVEVPPAEPPEAKPEPVEAPEPAPPPPARILTTRHLEPLRVEDLPKDPAARLAMARAALSAADRSEALTIYETLVNASELLDSVIDDLEADIRGHPDDSASYQLLGDACMKDGRLQDALQAYRTALTKL